MGSLRWGVVRILALSCLLAVAAPPASAQTTSHATAKSHKKKKSHKKVSSRHGQQKIDPERAREIQEALIREHYLNGKASGVWDDASQKAMKKYQADNGWQAKTTPDSRALIKLGLGPDHQHLLNPESAMTSAPQPAAAAQGTAPADAEKPRP
ncbi:MAG: peptidoglycan-binding domain-containing protein [Terriglobales bacterium]